MRLPSLAAPSCTHPRRQRCTLTPQAAWAHMRFTHFEIDLYRPTHVFPLLAFSRM